jgi:hypothetical protein
MREVGVPPIVDQFPPSTRDAGDGGIERLLHQGRMET